MLRLHTTVLCARDYDDYLHFTDEENSNEVSGRNKDGHKLEAGVVTVPVLRAGGKNGLTVY